ncbi:hypothetical protein [Pseudomonas sp. NFX98]|uniref:hypothetical protein n=1 Tax=Pseudomonas sp. NFX98 TaxID=3399122 RepID=UPI0039FB8BBE
MLLYTKKANNVFDFVDEKFGFSDISPDRAASRARFARWLPDRQPGPVLEFAHGYLRVNFSHIDSARLDEGLGRLAAVVRQAQAA